MIILVAAMSKDRVIGKDGWMPWDLPEDLKLFKQLTLNQKIVMGKVTFEGLKKPLPNRYTFVITRDTSYSYDHENVEVINDFDKLLQTYKNSPEELYICGGAQIYNAAIGYADKMYLSIVDGNFEGDTFFPEFQDTEWIISDEEKKEGFTFKKFTRN